MSNVGQDALARVHLIEEESRALGFAPTLTNTRSDLLMADAYDLLVKDPELRETTRLLFINGHHAQAVEEACKCLNNVVKGLTGLDDADGAGLMRTAFSPNKPILMFSGLDTRSDTNQQQGYMDIFAGMMTGVRNPRAHEHGYLDDPSTALELLGLANHLIRMARLAGPAQ